MHEMELGFGTGGIDRVICGCVDVPAFEEDGFVVEGHGWVAAEISDVGGEREGRAVTPVVEGARGGG